MDARQERHLAVARYWKASALKKQAAGSFAAAMKQFSTAAYHFRLAGEIAQSEIMERAAHPAAPPPVKLPAVLKKTERRTRVGRPPGGEGSIGAKRRQGVFAFICTYKVDHDGVSPSVRDIQEACGISSTSVVNWYLLALVKESLITVQYRQARTIQVVGGHWSRPDSKKANETG